MIKVCLAFFFKNVLKQRMNPSTSVIKQSVSNSTLERSGAADDEEEGLFFCPAAAGGADPTSGDVSTSWTKGSGVSSNGPWEAGACIGTGRAGDL